MSRSGYSDEGEYLDLYRSNVARTISGKKGQTFLKELAAAMDSMPERKLITDELLNNQGEVCAIGVVCKSRGLDTTGIDECDPQSVADLVGISIIMAAEIAYMNDEYCHVNETSEQRWSRMRNWVRENLKPSV